MAKAPTKKVKIARKIPIKRQPFKAQTLPKQLPESTESRKGCTLRKLMTNTPKLIRNNGQDVVVVKYQPRMKTQSGLRAIKAIMLTKDPYRTNRIPKPRETYMIGLDRDDPSKPLAKHKRILVSCSCEYYVFTCEYANAYHGAGRIIYCNGEPPMMTNPSMLPSLCKHLHSLALHIINKGD